jgi:Tfp pilus assembly protein PilX
MKPPGHPPAPGGPQRGASLLVILVLLPAMGVLALTAFHLARTQYQLVGNLQHQELAFVQAEAAAAAAERWLNTGSNATHASFATYDADAPGLYPVGGLAAQGLDPATMAWADSNSIVSGDGRYLIERMAAGTRLPGSSLQVGQKLTGACRAVHLFRIVAISTGTRGASRMVETFIATEACP